MIPDRPLPTITGTICLNLADCRAEQQRYEVWDHLTESPKRATVRVHVGARFPAYDAVLMLADFAEARSLTIEIEGDADAVRWWVSELRDAVRRLVSAQYATHLAEQRRKHLRVVRS